MTRISITSAIVDAEQRFVRSKQEFRGHLRGIQSTMSLLLAVGAGALVGSRLAGRKNSTVTAEAGGTKFPVRGLLIVLLIRFVLRWAGKRLGVA